MQIEQLEINDKDDNRNIGKYGADHILNNPNCIRDDEKIIVLTHCNTGSLATSGYGTALGIYIMYTQSL